MNLFTETNNLSKATLLFGYISLTFFIGQFLYILKKFRKSAVKTHTDTSNFYFAADTTSLNADDTSNDSPSLPTNEDTVHAHSPAVNNPESAEDDSTTQKATHQPAEGRGDLGSDDETFTTFTPQSDKPKPKKNTHPLILGFVIAILFAGLGAGLVLVQQQQDLRQQAYPGQCSFSACPTSGVTCRNITGGPESQACELPCDLGESKCTASGGGNNYLFSCCRTTPPPGPPGGAFICSWNRNGDPYFLICEDPSSGNGDDGIGQMRTSSTKALNFCQEVQNDRDYAPNNDCSAGQPKVIRWTSMCPRGTACEYTCDFCNIVNGKPTCGHFGDCSNNELTPPNNGNWNFAECAKCTSTNGADVTWDGPGGSLTINSITARNYRPQMQPVDTNGDGSTDDTRVQMPDSKLDFRLEIYQNSGATPIRTELISHTDSRVNCTYPTADTYSQRDNALHYLDCTLSGVTISGLTFTPGNTYSLKTWIKRGYITNQSEWVDYTADAQGTINRNICHSSFTMTTGPSPTPTPIPTPSPSPIPQCADLRVYTVNLQGTGGIGNVANWQLIPDTELSTLQNGQVVYVTILGSSTNAPVQFDRGRIRTVINNVPGQFTETSQIKPKQNTTDPDEFYIQHTITVTQTSSYRFEGEVCQLSGNTCTWW